MSNSRIKVQYTRGRPDLIGTVRWLEDGKLYEHAVGGCAVSGVFEPWRAQPVAPGEIAKWVRYGDGSTAEVREVIDAPMAGRAPLETRKAGKIRQDLVETGFPNALRALAEVMTWANEHKGYGEDDWHNLPNPERGFLGAAARHRTARLAGESDDPESKLPHLYHEAFNVLAQLEILIRSKDKQ